MPVYIQGGKILLSGGKIAVDEDCCCNETCSDCCTGPINGIEIVATGFANSDTECGENNCPNLNDTYCIAANEEDGCAGGTLEGPDWCGGEARWTYAITDNEDETCTLKVTLNHSITDDQVYGELDFNTGDACSELSGDMDMVVAPGLFHLCDYGAAAFHVNGTC